MKEIIESVKWAIETFGVDDPVVLGVVFSLVTIFFFAQWYWGKEKKKVLKLFLPLLLLGLVFVLIYLPRKNREIWDGIKDECLSNVGCVALLTMEPIPGTDEEAIKKASYFLFAINSDLGKKAKGYTVIDLGSIRQALSLLGLKDSDSIPTYKARSLGERLNAKVVILGHAAINNGSLELELKMLRSDEKQWLTSTVSKKGMKAETFEILVGTVNEILSVLGLSGPVSGTGEVTEKAADLFGLAYRKFSVGSEGYKEALKLLEQAIQDSPDFSDAWFLRGLIYLYEKNYDDAIQNLKKAVDLEPLNSDAFYALGVSFKAQRLYQEARENYQQAVSLKPSHSMAELGLAGALLGLGLTDQAKQIINRISSRTVEHRKILYNLAARYTELDQPDQAISYFQKALNAGLERRDVEWAATDPDFSKLQGDPRFQALIKKALDK